jgi:hypothetical protein
MVHDVEEQIFRATVAFIDLILLYDLYGIKDFHHR